MMMRGEFREDLYYRLKVIEVTVPPLRERRSEIVHLTGFFIDRYARRYNRPQRQLSDTLQQLFQTYDWPGNIRELENMIKRIVILQDEELAIREMSRSPRHAAAFATVGAARSTAAIARRQHPSISTLDAAATSRRRGGSRAAGADRDGAGRLRLAARREGRGPQGRAHHDRRHAAPGAVEPPPRGRPAGRQLQDAAEQDQGVRDRSGSLAAEKSVGRVRSGM